MTPGRTKGGRSAGHSPVKKAGSLGTGTRTAASGRARKHGETYAAHKEGRTEHAVRSVREAAEQTELAFSTDQLPGASSAARIPNGSANRLGIVDRPIHDWYRFVLSFPAHLVRYYISNFGLQNHAVVLDPFCGTGTTLVEARLQGMRVVGVEANPFACFASRVKLTWELDADLMLEGARRAYRECNQFLEAQGINDLDPGVAGDPVKYLTANADASKILLTNSISPLPLHKALVLRNILSQFVKEPWYGHALLALAKTVVFGASNLHFGPEVGVGKVKSDAPVLHAWLTEITRMAADIRSVNQRRHQPAEVHLADSRQLSTILAPRSVDAVITSPPYPNEKDYTRTTRLESVLLGFVRNREELRSLKRTLLRSNTRSVYKGDDDDVWIKDHPEINRIAEQIERRRIELGKTSGFEKLYPKVTKLYFGGMARHFHELSKVLKKGAHAAYVVGDQASYLRVMIRTGELLAGIAKALGYELVSIDLFRKRFATATRTELREEVVVLRWPK